MSEVDQDSCHDWKPVWGGSVRRCTRCKKKQWYYYCKQAYFNAAPSEIGEVHVMTSEQAGVTDPESVMYWDKLQALLPAYPPSSASIHTEDLDPENQPPPEND